jgi:hypothetical protein
MMTMRHFQLVQEKKEEEENKLIIPPPFDVVVVVGRSREGWSWRPGEKATATVSMATATRFAPSAFFPRTTCVP